MTGEADAPLRRDVRLLGTLLGQVLVAREEYVSVVRGLQGVRVTLPSARRAVADLG